MVCIKGRGIEDVDISSVNRSSCIPFPEIRMNQARLDDSPVFLEIAQEDRNDGCKESLFEDIECSPVSVSYEIEVDDMLEKLREEVGPTTVP